MVNEIMQVIIVACVIASEIWIMYVYIKISDWKKEQSRCDECGSIPIPPAPNAEVHATRIRLDNLFLENDMFERCNTCGKVYYPKQELRRMKN